MSKFLIIACFLLPVVLLLISRPVSASYQDDLDNDDEEVDYMAGYTEEQKKCCTDCYKLFKSCLQECYINLLSHNDVCVLNCRIDLGVCVNKKCSLTVCPSPRISGRCHEKCRSKTKKMQNDQREQRRDEQPIEITCDQC
ncbi:hypothetical protein niasHT_016908 [Heterodera trifolii]|uniref:Uncharacterized protein n=1 Tax=Heterodera trifolii TaxID=157864 RepID=A0ABD2KTI6_9BILA